MAQIIKENNILSEIKEDHHAKSWINIAVQIYDDLIFKELYNSYYDLQTYQIKIS